MLTAIEKKKIVIIPNFFLNKTCYQRVQGENRNDMRVRSASSRAGFPLAND